MVCNRCKQDRATTGKSDRLCSSCVNDLYSEASAAMQWSGEMLPPPFQLKPRPEAVDTFLRGLRRQRIGGVSVITGKDKEWLKDYAGIIW